MSASPAADFRRHCLEEEARPIWLHLCTMSHSMPPVVSHNTAINCTRDKGPYTGSATCFPSGSGSLVWPVRARRFLGWFGFEPPMLFSNARCWFEGPSSSPDILLHAYSLLQPRSCTTEPTSSLRILPVVHHAVFAEHVTMHCRGT